MIQMEMELSKKIKNYESKSKYDTKKWESKGFEEIEVQNKKRSSQKKYSDENTLPWPGGVKEHDETQIKNDNNSGGEVQKNKSLDFFFDFLRIFTILKYLSFNKLA